MWDGFDVAAGSKALKTLSGQSPANCIKACNLLPKCNSAVTQTASSRCFLKEETVSTKSAAPGFLSQYCLKEGEKAPGGGGDGGVFPQ